MIDSFIHRENFHSSTFNLSWGFDSLPICIGCHSVCILSTRKIQALDFSDQYINVINGTKYHVILLLVVEDYTQCLRCSKVIHYIYNVLVYRILTH